MKKMNDNDLYRYQKSVRIFFPRHNSPWNIFPVTLPRYPVWAQGAAGLFRRLECGWQEKDSGKTEWPVMHTHGRPSYNRREMIRKSTIHIVPLRPSTKLATWIKSCSDTSFSNVKGNGKNSDLEERISGRRMSDIHQKGIFSSATVIIA